MLQLAECLLFCEFSGQESPLLQIPTHYREAFKTKRRETVARRLQENSSPFHDKVISTLYLLEIPFEDLVVSESK